MPIYAYKCGSCGHDKDVLQKLSDPPLAVCPACGAAAFSKQLTAAGFQLKGSGWYATDFKGGSSAAPTSADGSKSADGAKTGDGKPADGAAKPADTASVTTKPDSPAKAAGGCGGGCACH
jgi:putative FmdB family regulatory protein